MIYFVCYNKVVLSNIRLLLHSRYLNLHPTLLPISGRGAMREDPNNGCEGDCHIPKHTREVAYCLQCAISAVASFLLSVVRLAYVVFQSG